MGFKEKLAKQMSKVIKTVPRSKKIEFVDKFYEKHKDAPNVDYLVAQLCNEIDLKQYDPKKKKKTD